jgi:hypothetical protein
MESLAPQSGHDLMIFFLDVLLGVFRMWGVFPEDRRRRRTTSASEPKAKVS